MAALEDNIYNLLEADGILTVGVEPEAIIEGITKHFTLVPKAGRVEPGENLFRIAQFGFFINRLKPYQIRIYMELWRNEIDHWNSLTDEPMGIFEFLTLDMVIIHYLILVDQTSAKGMVDVAPGGSGYMAHNFFLKYMKLLEMARPKPKPKAKPKKKTKKKEVKEETPANKEPVYKYGDRLMDEAEFKEWKESLTDDEKVEKLPHVVEL